MTTATDDAKDRLGASPLRCPDNAATHYVGCPCHEAAWAEKLAAAERRAEEAEKSRDVAVAQVAGRPTWDDLQFATDQVNAAELKAEGEREFRRRAESSLASERAARESWEREFNVANAERIRLHNEAENLSERLHQFEAAGFPNVATVLDRVEAERAAREKAEKRLEESRHTIAISWRDIVNSKELISLPSDVKGDTLADVLAFLLRERIEERAAREKAERERDEARDNLKLVKWTPNDDRMMEMLVAEKERDEYGARLARVEAALLSLAKVGEDDDGQPVLRISCGFHCETADMTELPLVWAALAEIGGKR